MDTGSLHPVFEIHLVFASHRRRAARSACIRECVPGRPFGSTAPGVRGGRIGSSASAGVASRHRARTRWRMGSLIGRMGENLRTGRCAPQGRVSTQRTVLLSFLRTCGTGRAYVGQGNSRSGNQRRGRFYRLSKRWRVHVDCGDGIIGRRETKGVQPSLFLRSV